MNEYKVLKSEPVYSGKIISVVKDTVEMPNGRIATREVVQHGGAAAMIPVTDEGKIIFVRQYRHPALKETLEIPAGTIEKGEKPLECAVREIEEETSFKAGKITPLIEFYSAIGFCQEILYVYVCENLVKGNFNLDEDELINTETHTLDEAIDMIFTGEICDSKTVAALLAYKEKCQRGM